MLTAATGDRPSPGVDPAVDLPVVLPGSIVPPHRSDHPPHHRPGSRKEVGDRNGCSGPSSTVPGNRRATPARRSATWTRGSSRESTVTSPASGDTLAGDSPASSAPAGDDPAP